MQDFEQLALKYSLPKVKKALEALRIKPGQSFFPRPDEVAQEIETQRECGINDDIRREGQSFFERQRRLMEQYNSPEEVAWRKEMGFTK